MKCPYCNTEMKEGILQSNRYLLWAKTKHKLSYHPKDEEILLDEKMIGDVTVEAYICKDCKKIILDYNI
ncbi:PF20097 family protein [Inediibacterium massiliense]|uniref:PF20097 family protein n=1 Tax=Inediibacterium massiliense TaxID=1658111 RepID=UPI0006B527D6|nr:PF20097 family protein [Inediibacterium massiliense]